MDCGAATRPSGDKSKNKSPEQQLACPFCFLCSVGLCVLIKTLKVICPRRGEGTFWSRVPSHLLLLGRAAHDGVVIIFVIEWQSAALASGYLGGFLSARRAFFYFMAPATNFNGPLFGSSRREEKSSRASAGRNKLPCASQSFFTLSSNLNLESRMGGAPPRERRKGTPSRGHAAPETAFVFWYHQEPPLADALTRESERTPRGDTTKNTTRSFFPSLNQ